MGKFKFILAVFVLFAVVVACNRFRDRDKDEDAEKDKDRSEKFERSGKDEDEDAEEVQMKIVYGNPYLLGNSPYVLIPVRLASTDEDIFGKLKREYFLPEQLYTKYSDSYNRLNYGNMYNVLFYNSSDSTCYSLLDRKAFINKFYIPSERGADTTQGNFIIFTLSEQDYNNDNDIDGDDGETVYKCSLYGKDVRQISPDRIQLIDWKTDDANDRIYMYITEDSNGDKKFNNDDNTMIISTSISNSGVGKEIISDSIKNSMKSLYLK